ncbi:MAG: hypothetical protein H6R10_2242 [Rhodocyclaceae bacterium]|nr:hypothetical protein [Rhodocyclaceae bacterium]
MEHGHFTPTLRASLETAARLVDGEAGLLPGYVRARDRQGMIATLQAGWRQVMRIKARATVHCLMAERTRRRTP